MRISLRVKISMKEFLLTFFVKKLLSVSVLLNWDNVLFEKPQISERENNFWRKWHSNYRCALGFGQKRVEPFNIRSSFPG